MLSKRIIYTLFAKHSSAIGTPSMDPASHSFQLQGAHALKLKAC